MHNPPAKSTLKLIPTPQSAKSILDICAVVCAEFSEHISAYYVLYIEHQIVYSTIYLCIYVVAVQSTSAQVNVYVYMDFRKMKIGLS